MRQISSHLPEPIRMVGLSTSLANAKDLGQWLGATSHATFNFPPGVCVCMCGEVWVFVWGGVGLYGESELG